MHKKLKVLYKKQEGLKNFSIKRKTTKKAIIISTS